jgi:hypothetical protein
LLGAHCGMTLSDAGALKQADGLKQIKALRLR